uniref:rhomboid protease n=1 Tax=Caenorhabditis japonica TaxID=281687 RepID=A0A8R1HL10_CAEJA
MFKAEGKYKRTYRHQFNQICTGDETEIPLSTLASRIETRKIPLSSGQIKAIKEAPDQLVDVDEFQRIVTSKSAQKSSIKRLMYDVADPIISKSQKIEVHSYIDSYTCCPPPIFMILISMIQIGLFIYFWYTDGSRSIWTDCAGCFVTHDHSTPGLLIFAPKLRAQAWRFTSYMFLHAGLNHLLGNVFIQIVVGVPLEVVHKIWRIGPIYLLAVTSGALLQYAVDPRTLLVGASAGVYALIFAHVANVILARFLSDLSQSHQFMFQNWHEMPFRWIRVLLLSLFISLDFGGAVHRRFFTDQCDTISHLAHIAGAVTGLVFGYFVLYNVIEHKIEKIGRYFCLILYITLFVVTVVMVIIRAPTADAWWDDKKCT